MKIVRSSGNVFADLNLPDADLLQSLARQSKSLVEFKQRAAEHREVRKP